jgi:hypothetical protein
MDGSLSATGARRLNHVEFAHRPGEGHLAMELFAALGCVCSEIDSPPYGKYVVVSLDGSPHGENDIFVSQAEPEQLALENALQGEIAYGGSGLGAAAAEFRRMQHQRPYRATHFGLRLPSVTALNEAIAKLSALSEGSFAGRLELGYAMHRSIEEARATSSPVQQIWVWTDVISTGLLAFGQQIELQAYDV